jgi:small-conductance mechanosensitive channel
MNDLLATLTEALTDQQTYVQAALILVSLFAGQIVAGFIRRRLNILKQPPADATGPNLQLTVYQLGRLLVPALTILILKISSELILDPDSSAWLSIAAITILVVYAYFKAIGILVSNQLAARALLMVGIPLLALQSVGALPYLTSILQSIGIEVGNIRITLLGVMRVTIFGSLIFWLGRISNATGQQAIRKQEKLDFRTREVAAKLFEIGVFVVASLLLLQIMGINLTALAVFGGALGVGLGFGLQSIASNFISGLIILLDRSLSIGDFIELEDGRSGYVTALNMRSTTLETFEGKDIMVPNEMFITGTFVNWTHKNEKQRYRVDFSVAYNTDIRKLVEVIKEAVATHPQVLSGEEYPIEERPDCEIDSFGDSGVNMFVEFWIEAIDDGKNRVGGDLLLIIYETMRDHGFTIPFPQREVRILNEGEAEIKSVEKK